MLDQIKSINDQDDFVSKLDEYFGTAKQINDSDNHLYLLEFISR